jgi:citrate synthase
MMSGKGPRTSIGFGTADDVYVRGKSLCRELIGAVTFTEMAYFHVVGAMPTPAQTRVLDACLVTLMEHGLTPSVLATRLVEGSAPEAMQAAVAAGILAVGSVLVGSVEGCAAVLARLVAAEAGVEAEARRVVEEHRAAKLSLPGFGHPVHKPDDPRTPRILAVAESAGVAGRHVEALWTLGRVVDELHGRHLTINATGAIAAALADAGVSAGIMRGFAILARCAGLVGHLREEQERPSMRAIWEAAERAVPYDGERRD